MAKDKHVLITVVLAVLVSANVLSPTMRARGMRAQFEVSGTSTVRGWSCLVDGEMETTPGESSDPLPGFPRGLSSVKVTVQVDDFQCPEDEMNKHLREAMEVASYPYLVFELERYSINADKAEASGTITIHGEMQPIAFQIGLVESSDGIVGIGKTEIDMTKFGVTPPSVWLGLLNVGNMVTIDFNAPLPSGE